VIDKIEIFKMAGDMASQAIARQSVIARNIANADTPGYRAQDIASFAETYRSNDSQMTMRATRAGHLDVQSTQFSNPETFETDDPASPNGNSVSLESEMVKASELRYQYDLALSIYSTSLGILRTSIGRR